MIRRAHWGGLPLLLAPFGAWALGLGDIELRSALNQPLDANIELVSATPVELADLRVSLAPPETFQRYGLDRPGFLGRLSFAVGRDNVGRNVIRVTSSEPIAEPFVTVLVEAIWSRGRLLREYTVLLDPPVMLPQQAAVEPIQPAAARAPQPATPAAAIQRPPVPPAATVAEPVRTPAPAASVTAPQQPASAPVADRPGAYGPVQRGETLWAIASRYRPAGVTMNQMMVAIYRANPAAFQGNMNLLRLGANLELPGDAALGGLSAAEATRQAVTETNAWSGETEQQARLRLLPPEVEAAPTRVAGAGASATPAAAGADAPGAAEGTGGGTPAASERILSIQDEALSNLQQLAAEPPVAEVAPSPLDTPAGVDGVIGAGVDLESEEIFAEESELSIDEPAGTVDAAEIAEEPVAAPPPRSVSTSTQVVATAPSQSLISRVIGWLAMPLIWVIVGIAALVGAGAVYLRSRQTDGDDSTGRWEALEAESDEDVETREATERLRSQVRLDENTIVVEEQHTQELPQPEQSAEEFFDVGEDEGGDVLPEAEFDVDFGVGADADLDVDVDVDVDADADLDAGVHTKINLGAKSITTETPAATGQHPIEATLSSQTVINLDQADPIAEADFHMAYGLYDQAADLVSKALEANEDDRGLRLKLLEVYFVWGNSEAFLDTARILKASIGNESDSDWDKVVIMGKQICPDESLFAEATSAAGDSVDLDLDAGASTALDLAFDDESLAAMDLDLNAGDADVTLELDGTGEASDEDVFDLGDALDVGEHTAAGLEAAFFEQAQHDPSAKTSPNLDIEAQTQEAPTLETLGPDAPTIESPVFEQDIEASAELPTLQQPRLSVEDLGSGDQTTEIDLDDLGLDLDLNMDDLTDLGDTPTGSHQSLLDIDEEDADVLSATGVTQVLSGGDQLDAGDQQDDSSTAEFVRTEVLQSSDGDSDSTAHHPKVSEFSADSFGLDLDLDVNELSAALDGEDTVEQPSVGRFGGNKDIDLDVSFEVAGSDDPAPREPGASRDDAQTMTEVGTKLDLARAYIDMGDPEGARSILEEVLDEGDSSQQQEAQGLIKAL